jgi:hypothetical protein
VSGGSKVRFHAVVFIFLQRKAGILLVYQKIREMALGRI